MGNSCYIPPPPRNPPLAAFGRWCLGAIFCVLFVLWCVAAMWAVDILCRAPLS